VEKSSILYAGDRRVRLVSSEDYANDCVGGLNMLDSAELCRLFGRVRTDTGVSVHKLAQNRICEMGKQLGYVSIAEYCMPSLVIGGRTSYVDVVWLSQGRLAVAFEIRAKSGELDIVTTRKDTEKLRLLNPLEKFIVNVSKVSGKAYFHKLTDACLE
jgi:hypothetical protein